MPQSFKQKNLSLIIYAMLSDVNPHYLYQAKKCDYWWRGSVRPPLGLARLPKKLGYRRVK